MATSGNPTSEYPIPGNNKTTYGPVPQAEQVFEIETLDIAPLPIPVDETFSTHLRISLPHSKASDLGITNALLSTATLTVTSTVIYPEGQHGSPWSSTIPLQTFSAGLSSIHFSIRNSSCLHVDFLTLDESETKSMNEILAEYWFPGMWLETGTWTFEFIAKMSIPKGKEVCLFALRFTQWLEGRGTGGKRLERAGDFEDEDREEGKERKEKVC